MNNKNLAEQLLKQIEEMEKSDVHFVRADFLRVIDICFGSIRLEQKEAINTLKDALDDAVDTLGRFDWDCSRTHKKSCEFSGSGGTIRMCKIHKAQSNIERVK